MTPNLTRSERRWLSALHRAPDDLASMASEAVPRLSELSDRGQRIVWRFAKDLDRLCRSPNDRRDERIVVWSLGHAEQLAPLKPVVVPAGAVHPQMTASSRSLRSLQPLKCAGEGSSSWRSVSAWGVTSTGGSKPSSCATRRISSSLMSLTRAMVRFRAPPPPGAGACRRGCQNPLFQGGGTTRSADLPARPRDNVTPSSPLDGVGGRNRK